MPTSIPNRFKAGFVVLAVLSSILIISIIGLILGSTSEMSWSSSPIFQRAASSGEEVTDSADMLAPEIAMDAAWARKNSALSIAPMPPGYPTPGATKEEREIAGPRIIKNGAVSIRVNDVQQSFVEVGTIAKGFGGYVADGQINSGDTIPSASITVRIPNDKYDATVQAIEKIAVVKLSSYVSTEDVTAAFVDLEARLKAAKAEEAQYLEILKRANSIEDTLNVTARLSDVRTRIEQLEGQLRSLNDRTDYATLTVNLTQEARINIPTSDWRPISTIKSAGQNLVVALQILIDGLLVAVVFVLGLLFPIFLVLFIVVKLLLWAWRKTMGKRK